MLDIRYYLRLIRPVNLLIIAFTMYMVRFAFLYPIFKVWGLGLQINEVVFFLFTLAFVLMAAGGYIINDYYDLKIDTINKPEKVVIGKYVSPSGALKLYWIHSIIGLLFGCWSSWKMGLPLFGLIFILYFLGLWFYSYKLKRQFLMGNIVIALFLAIVPLTSGLTELLPLYYQPIEYVKAIFKPNEVVERGLVLQGICFVIGISAFAFIISLAREIVKDIEDIEGDSSIGCKTLPIVLGKKIANRISQFLLLLIFIALGYLECAFKKDGYTLLYLPSFIYFVCLVQIPIILVIFKQNKAISSHNFHTISNWIKAIMVSGICYLFLFASFFMFIDYALNVTYPLK